MRQVRVALSIDRLNSRVPGGIGRYTYELWTALSSQLPEQPETISPPKLGSSRALGLLAWQFLNYPRIHCDADVVHATSLAIPPTSKPLVVTVHDLIFDKFPQAFTKWGLAFHRRGITIASEHARAVITPSRAVADEMCERYPSLEGRVVAIHHGVPSFCERKADNRDVCTKATKVLGLDEKEYFLWVGTIEPRKNLFRVVQAFAVLASAHASTNLVLAGKVGWKMSLEAVLQRAPVEKGRDRIHFFENPSDTELRYLYENSLALVFPSLDEGFGFPLLEAMALGTPILSSDIPAVREVVGDAALLVNPRRVGQLAEAMDAVAKDRNLAHRLSQAGLERATRFTWEKSARSHIEVYKKAAVF